ncbi:MAG TPA: hypothetical protein VHJ76_07395 [Actinomycetota bacterium]|nr:hypothetical protein [Actinomycetota bacterium]
MKAVKTIAALIFLAAVAIVLVQPVLGADDEGPAPEARREASPPESPEPSPDAEPQDDGRVRVVSRYPERCLRKDVGSTGLVAARRGSTATIGFPGRAPVARVGVSGDVVWSPSGTFLAERGGRVFDQSGNPQGALFFEPRQWQWSPVADCALALTERGNLTFSIPDTTRKGIRLLDAPVEEFDVSPNGRRVAAVVGGGGLWIADLRDRDAVQATEGPASIAGWFSNRSVLYSRSRDSGKLRFASGRGRTRVVRDAFAGGSLVRCNGRTLQASPATKFNPPLVELAARRGRIVERTLAAAGGYHGYSGAACSPHGAFLAASTMVRDERGPLVLLRPDGTFVRELVGGRTANPQWSQEGLMYVRFGNGGRGRLWLIGPGADPIPTQYTVGAPTQYDWHVR